MYLYPTDFVNGLEIYRLFNIVVKLDVCVRQEAIQSDPDQLKFIELLPRIRNAVNDAKTVDDWKFLLKNEYTLEKAKGFEGIFKLFEFHIKLS